MLDVQWLGRQARRWGIYVLLGALAGVLAATLSSLRHPPSYVATATVEVLGVPSDGDPTGSTLDSQVAEARTDLRVIRGSAVLSDVLAVTHMRLTPEELATQIEAVQVPDTTLIHIRAYAGDGASAAYLANQVAAAFVARAVADRATTLATARTSLEQRRDANEQDLQTALVRQATLRGQAQRTPAEQAELDRLGADVAGYVLTRSGALRDLDEIRRLQAVSATPVRLVDPATPPAEPIAVRGLLSLGVAALGGGLAAALALAALAYAAGALDTAEDTHQALRLPILGVIPRHRVKRET